MRPTIQHTFPASARIHLPASRLSGLLIDATLPPGYAHVLVNPTAAAALRAGRYGTAFKPAGSGRAFATPATVVFPGTAAVSTAGRLTFHDPACLARYLDVTETPAPLCSRSG